MRVSWAKRPPEPTLEATPAQDQPQSLARLLANWNLYLGLQISLEKKAGDLMVCRKQRCWEYILAGEEKMEGDGHGDWVAGLSGH